MENKHSNLEQFVKENLDKGFKNGKLLSLEENRKTLGELFKAIATNKGEKRMNAEDFEAWVVDTESYDLTASERYILNMQIEEGRKQFPSVSEESFVRHQKALSERYQLQSPESKETPSEASRMTPDQIEQAVTRNQAYNTIQNTDEKVREVCSKINYTREDLGNGREKHIINGIPFSFPKSDEFTFADMKENDTYTMDGITKNNDKYDKFKTETGMHKLSPEKVYDLLGEFAKAMGITSTIDHKFFKSNSDESDALLQMFRNITGFEGKILLNITKKGDVECLCCRSGGCCFDDYYDHADSVNVAFLSGL